jgi:uncharacterized membrane protein HdeD (DUF308 family)
VAGCIYWREVLESKKRWLMIVVGILNISVYHAVQLYFTSTNCCSAMRTES